MRLNPISELQLSFVYPKKLEISLYSKANRVDYS